MTWCECGHVSRFHNDAHGCEVWIYPAIAEKAHKCPCEVLRPVLPQKPEPQ
jgi:hypothetical protein